MPSLKSIVTDTVLTVTGSLALLFLIETAFHIQVDKVYVAIKLTAAVCYLAGAIVTALIIKHSTETKSRKDATRSPFPTIDKDLL